MVVHLQEKVAAIMPQTTGNGQTLATRLAGRVWTGYNQSMLPFLLTRFLRVVMVLVGVALIMFLLMHAIPGNPWSSDYSSSPRAMVGLNMDKSTQRELDRRFGLDLPLWRQFTRYAIGDFDEDGSFFCGAVCGNLGPSIQQRGRSVSDILFGPPEGKTFLQSRFGYSIRLILFASLIAVGLGIPLGLLSGMRPYSALSQMTSVGLAALISVPNFVLGLLAMIVLASWLSIIKVLPDWDSPGDWIVPALVLAVLPMATIARVTRASVINVLNADYVRTARAKGLTESRVMLGHVLRNALLPIITFTGPTLVEMFAALLIIESLYSFPGFGREYWGAVLNLDYPMIMGLTLIYATAVVVVNVVIEFVSEVLDPRIRMTRRQGLP
jgi:oligopeptide transport system permease protein